MLVIYKGPPGTGKSYHAVKDGLDHIYTRRDGHVIANFDITRSREGSRNWVKEQKWHYLEEWPESPEVLVRMVYEFGTPGKKEGTVKVFCDEAGIYFNSRDWQINPRVRKEWIRFFSQSRHLGVDVVFIVQDERMLDRQIRSLCEYIVSHAIMNRYGILKLLPFKLMVAVSRWQAGNFRGQMSVYPLLPWVAKRYNHMAMFGQYLQEPEAAKAAGVGGPAEAGGPDPAPVRLETMAGFAGGLVRYDLGEKVWYNQLCV